MDDSLGDNKDAMVLTAAEHRGTSRGQDTGHLHRLFDGKMFDNRKPALASMVQFMTDLSHSDGTVGVGLLAADEGDGKSFMLQRAYDTALGDAALDARTMRIRSAMRWTSKTNSTSLLVCFSITFADILVILFEPARW